MASQQFSLTAGILLGLLVAAEAGAGQAQQPLPSTPDPTTRPAQSAPTNPTPATSTPTDSDQPIVPPAELGQIKRALSRAPGLVLDDKQYRFYVEIVAKRPTFAEYVKGYDLVNGPTRRGNPMTHQEFLNLVTPRDFYSSAGIKPTEMLQFAITNWLGQTLIKQAIEDMLRARTERERDEIRARIDRELAALTAGQDK